MGLLRRFLAGAAVGGASVAYARAILRRNDSLVRPPVLGSDGRPMAGRTFRYSDGETVELIDAGEGASMLWVPGADGPKETFRYQLPHFARRWRVVAADLRVGFGPDDGFDRLAADLAELIDGLGTGPVVLVGQSLGSAIALRFASLHPDLTRGLVLSNPLARVSYEHVGLNTVALTPLAIWSTRYLPTVASRALARLWSRLGLWIYDDTPGSDRLIDYALYTGARTVRASVAGQRVDRLKPLDLRPALPSIGAPALVVKGEGDTYLPASWAREMADRLPRCRYVEIPGGHCAHISQPGAFNRVVDAWLVEVLRADAGSESAGRGAPTGTDGGSE